MKFWYMLIGIVALIVLFPYIRCFFKRLTCMGKIKKLCHNKGYKMHSTHPLWFLGSKHANKCDLYIETKKEIFAIKLFGIARRPTILIIKENGEYFIRSFIIPISHGCGVTMHTNGKPKPLPTYDFGYKTKNEWEKKSQRNILLFSPVSMDIRYQTNNGNEKSIGAGDIVNGMEIYLLPQLLKTL